MYLMVLNDGTTFTSLDGCRIVEIPDDKVDISTRELQELPSCFAFVQDKGLPVIVQGQKRTSLIYR